MSRHHSTNGQPAKPAKAVAYYRMSTDKQEDSIERQRSQVVPYAARNGCNLDLVITTDTAIAHLAGELGAPVWLVLSTIVDWRWLLKREDTPWYPTLRLFRQRTLGDWDERDERLRGRIQASVGPGKKILYGHADLLRYLADNRWHGRVNGK